MSGLLTLLIVCTVTWGLYRVSAHPPKTRVYRITPMADRPIGRTYGDRAWGLPSYATPSKVLTHVEDPHDA